MMSRSSLAIMLLMAMILLLIFSITPIFALEQIANGTFDGNASGWTQSNGIDHGNLSTFGYSADGSPSAGSFYGYTPTAGSNNREEDGLIEQTFSTLAAANCRITANYKNSWANRPDRFGIYVRLQIAGSGTTPNETVAVGLLSELTEYADPSHGSWTSAGTVNALLDASTNYIYRVYWDHQCDSNEAAGTYIDGCSCVLSPSGLNATDAGASVSLTWNASTGESTLDYYNVYSSATSGGPWTLLGTSNTNSYSAPVSALEVTYYCVEDVDTNGIVSPKSPEAMLLKIVVRDGLGPDQTYSFFENRAECNWDYVRADLLRYEVAFGTTAGGTDVVGWTNVGLSDHHAFTGISLASGTTYFSSVRALDTMGTAQGQGSSNGFIARHDQVLTDTSASMFFNNARVLDMIDLTTDANSLRVKSFSNGGGGYWEYKVPVLVTEPGVTERINAPCRIQLSGLSGMGNVREIRVCDDQGTELPRYNLNSNTSNPDIVFLVNMRQGETRTYWVYWGNASASDPAYGFSDTATRTSMYEWTPYYSRKNIPAGIISTPLALDLKPEFGWNLDDGYSNWFNLPWPFTCFDDENCQNGWRIAINGFMSRSGSMGDYSNRFSEFRNNFDQMIAPLWIDLMVRNPGTPQDEGVFRDVLSSPDRLAITYRCNRYNKEDDIYMVQTVLHKTGDIELRYEYLSPLGVIGPAGPYDRAANDENTVGISNGNNDYWLTNTPLNIGIAKSPTAFYQCYDAFRGNYTVGTVIGPSGSRSEVAHMESMVFDSTVANPDWLNFEYDCTGNGGRLDFDVRTGNTPLPELGGWGAWTNVDSNRSSGRSRPIPASVADVRFIQYRVILKKSNATHNPILEEVRFVYGGISVDNIIANEPNGVSQGQDNIPVSAEIRNFYSSAISLTSTALSFTLGSYTYSLSSPALPANIPAGGTINANFIVSVWDDSPTGSATVHASAIAAANPFSDDDAQDPYFWQVKRKAQLSITKVETIPTHVNKGQNGIPVRVYMTNLGECPYAFDGATLTFSLGDYTQSIVSPAIGTIINGGSSFIATLSVNVAPTSPSGVSIINSTAAGTNTFSNKVTEDFAADVSDTWTIQNPASIVLEEVTASSTVYRGQTNTPVYLRVSNQGEATANWLTSDLLSHFTLGTYDSVYAISSFPALIPGGLQTTARYGVDISPISATGNSDVDADISGTDKNTLFPISYSGALLPASWTILAEKITTYKDATFLSTSISFNRPTAGTTEVYARGTDLLPFGEFVVRWLDPSSSEVLVSPVLTADASGILIAEYSVDNTSPSGQWKIQITNPIGTVISCENTFEVVSPADLTIALELPYLVSVGQPFVASLTYINIGGANINSANTSNIDPNGPGVAIITNGPIPPVINVSGNSQATATWNLVAQSAGNYTASATGYGFDANSGLAISSPAKTSNVCVIQNPPIVVVNSVVTTPNVVYLNQKNLTITANIRNNGQASAIIDAASIHFTLGGYTQNMISHSLPYELVGGASINMVFDITVNATSTTGVSDISANLNWYDKNWAASSTAITSLTPKDSWEVRNKGFVLSENVEFAPEQDNFNLGQTVYMRAYGYNPGDLWYRIRLYDYEVPSTATISPNGGRAVSPQLSADNSGFIDFFWTLPTTGASIGVWSVVIDDGDATNEGTIEALQYFNVQAPGNLVASMTISPTSVFKGETFTVTLIASNTVANGSTIVNATASLLVKSPSATGDAIYLSGPVPASATVDALSQQEFTWTYQATQDTTLVGSYSLTASLSYSLSGQDANSSDLVTSNVSFSSPLIIYGRSVELSSTTLDYGSVLCGDAVISNSSAVNTGNYPLDNIRWIVTDLNGAGANKISKANLAMSPDPIGFINAGVSEPASGALWVPYNQPADTYVATMSIFNDRNGNNSFDIDEVYDLFQVKVVVPPCKRVFVVEDSVNLEGWSSGETTLQKQINVFSGGNLPLDNIKFAQHLATTTSTISVTPVNYGPLPTLGAFTANVSANIAGPIGTYIATWTVWNDEDNDGNVDVAEASDTFQVWLQIGNKSFTVLPDPVDAGVGTPSTVITGFGPTLTNTGSLDLRHLKSLFLPLSDGLGNTIASAGIGINPAMSIPIPSGDTPTVNLRLFVPAGQPTGTYIGTQTLYEDSNENGIIDVGEARTTFDLKVFVPLIRLVQVLQSTVSLGGVSPGTTRAISFPCRNIGNVDLAGLRWVKTNLRDGAGNVIPSAAISFPPEGPTDVFSVPAGQFFMHDIQIAVPPGQIFGDYLSIPAHYWLYEDYNPANSARDVPDEPDSRFKVACQIGEQKLNIVETFLSVTDDPNATTTPITFNVKNIGSLILNNPKATATAFIPTVAGPIDIPANTNVFAPVNLGNISVNQIVQSNWSVNIPACTPAATYISIMTIWEDVNNDGIIDLAEARDTAELRLTVNSAKVVDVIQTQLDLGWTSEASVAQGVIEIYNAGNVDLDNVDTLSYLVSNGFANIPAVNITFLPDPVGSIAVGTSELATISVTVGIPQADGTYRADQRVFDDYNAANGNWDIAEESDTFELLLRIGRQYLYETAPTNPPVVFGNRDPGSVHQQAFTVFNGNAVPLSKISWLVTSPFTDGGNTIPIASLTFLPATTFGIPGGGNQPCTANIDVASHILAGNYTATAKVWEDNNLDSIVQGNEASATFQLTLTVNPFEDLDILLATVDFGTIVRGSTVAVEIGFKNIGNETLTGFNWTFVDLIGPETLGAANLTASPTYLPDPLSPSAFGTSTVYLTIPRDLEVGSYGPSASQLLEDGTNGSDTATFQCEVIGRSLYEEDPSNPDVAFGSQKPGETYTESLTLYNNTDAELQNVKWIVVDQFTDGVNSIPAASLTFTPLPIASIVGNGDQVSTASVEVGSSQEPGNYVATATVWEDDNDDGIVDADEASATFQLTLTIATFQDLDILLADVDFGTILKGASTSVEVGFQNIGNVDITGFSWTFADLNSPAPAILSAANFTASPTYLPDPVPPSGYGTATIYLSIPRTQLSGVYGPDGSQLLVDGTTASDTCTFSCIVESRSLYEQAPSNPDVVFGALNPGVTSEQSCDVFNNTAIELQNIKWVVVDEFTDGTNTIPAASLTFSPIPPPSIDIIGGGGNSVPSTATIDIGIYQAPGNYVATATVWEDENDDGIVDADEASATFQLTLTVNSIIDLDILLADIDFGSIVKGATTSVEIGFQNIGNVDVTGFSWTFADLNSPAPAVLAASNFIASPTYVPATVSPGAYSTSTIYLSIPRTQLSGAYGLDGPQLLVDGTVTASDTCRFSCVVEPRSLYEQASDNPDVVFGAQNPGASYAQSCDVYNNTAIEIQNVKWFIVNEFTDGTNNIPAASLTFTPLPIVAIAGNGSQAATANIEVGPSQSPGDYVATATVWEDDNDDGIVDADEASATFQLTLTVNPFQDLDILLANVDFGTVLKGASTSVEVGFQNIGNVDITGFSWTFADLNNPAVLSATNFTASPTFVPDPLTPGAYGTATIYLSIPRTQLSGIYTPDGPQLLVDGTTASDTCTFSCIVEPRSLYEMALGNPDVVFGTQNPGASYSQNCDVYNNTGIELQNIKWTVVNQFADGAKTIPIASLTFIPSPIATINGAGNQPSTANVEVGPYQAPGDYVATATVWEDDNDDGLIDADEASATFQLTLTVDTLQDLDILLADVDFGSIVRGDVASVEVGFQNIGNVNITGFNWTFSDLNSPAVLAAANLSANPIYVPDPVTPGAYGTSTVSLSIPRAQLPGTYVTAGLQVLADGGTAEDSCTFRCVVEKRSLYEQTPANPDVVFGPKNPGATYTQNCNLTNETSVALNNVKWKVVNPFTDGANTIPAINLTFTPNPIVLIAGSLTQASTANIEVDPYQAPGDYVATATVWEDDDGDGNVDADEAFATFQLTLTVNTVQALDVLAANHDFGTIIKGDVASIEVCFQNIGNVDATGFSWTFANLNVPVALSAANFTASPTYVPDPVTPGTYATATIYLSIPRTQPAGIYTPGGPQAFTDGTAFDTCTFSCVVEGRSLYEEAIGNPDVVFGEQDPGATYLQPVRVFNNTAIGLQNVKWIIVNEFTNSFANTIPAASLTFTPNPIATIAGSANQPSNAHVEIGAYQEPGDYVATATVWEDDNGDGAVNTDEASATFQLTLRVKGVYKIDIIPSQVDFGQIAQGATGLANITFRNTGNLQIDASQLSWGFLAMNKLPANIPAGDISCLVISSVDPVMPGNTAISDVQISVSSSQSAGHYGPANVQTLTITALGSPSDTCNFICEVTSDVTGLDLAAGTIYQKLSPEAIVSMTKNNIADPDNRYILSAWVCPGSGSARLGFLLANDSGVATDSISINIDANGKDTLEGAMTDISYVDSGITNTVQFIDPVTLKNFTYYRIFIAFDFSYVTAPTGTPNVILQNSTPDTTASYTTWFDGVQLEKAIKPNMTKPTSYRPYNKIVSPNVEQTIEGGSSYYEW